MQYQTSQLLFSFSFLVRCPTFCSSPSPLVPGGEVSALCVVFGQLFISATLCLTTPRSCPSVVGPVTVPQVSFTAVTLDWREEKQKGLHTRLLKPFNSIVDSFRFCRRSTQNGGQNPKLARLSFLSFSFPFFLPAVSLSQR